jgi:hypothetical protein
MTDICDVIMTAVISWSLKLRQLQLRCSGLSGFLLGYIEAEEIGDSRLDQIDLCFSFIYVVYHTLHDVVINISFAFDTMY